MSGIAQIEEVCISRNGERCKDCIYYGKQCQKWKNHHGGVKPCERDLTKYQSMKYYKSQYNGNNS